MTIFVTGAAGFIGFHLAKRLLHRGEQVVGLDNLNDYYDVGLKKDRLALLTAYPGFRFYPADLTDAASLETILDRHKPEQIVHLAAQAGVRYSLTHPEAYIQSNLVGFANMLEACRKRPVRQFLYASSSSVYGANAKLPFSVEDRTDHPVSLYAATKKSNELLAHAYSHLYGMPTVGLRFFTVYGPWGRPDMAYFTFTRSILAGKPIAVYNYGEMKRDFTYIDDIVTGVELLLDRGSGDAAERTATAETGSAPYRVYNIGNSRPVELLEFIRILEKHLGREAVIDLQPLQPGDVLETYADVEALQREIGFEPATALEEGLGHFVRWYVDYYGKQT